LVSIFFWPDDQEVKMICEGEVCSVSDFELEEESRVLLVTPVTEVPLVYAQVNDKVCAIYIMKKEGDANYFSAKLLT